MILNYTTQVPVSKTAAEIQEILRKHGATAVTNEYDSGKIVGLSFEVTVNEKVLAFRLPVRPEPIATILLKQHKRTAWGTELERRKKSTIEQAERTAWRILKDWIEAQMALIEVQMVKMDQVFLPYMIASNGKTLYEIMAGSRFLLPERGS